MLNWSIISEPAWTRPRSRAFNHRLLRWLSLGSSLLFLPLSICGAATASLDRVVEEQFTVAEVKSAFLLNFGRFVEWPTQVLQKSPSRFMICIIGADTLGKDLDSITRGQKVKDRTVDIVRLPPQSPVTNCQIAYLNLSNDKQTSDILSHIKTTPTLTVGNDPAFLKAGGMIQLQVQGERVHLKINLTSVQASGLTISSKLLAISEVVQ